MVQQVAPSGPFSMDLAVCDEAQEVIVGLENPSEPVRSPGAEPASQSYMFHFVLQVVADSAGNVYVAGWFNGLRIRKFSRDGVLLRSIGPQGRG